MKCTLKGNKNIVLFVGGEKITELTEIEATEFAAIKRTNVDSLLQNRTPPSRRKFPANSE